MLTPEQQNEWAVALCCARLAPTTGSCPIPADVVLAINEELITSQDFTLRDQFAATATEEDIAAQKSKVPVIERAVIGSDGTNHTQKVMPADWRQLARYLHADAMLRARNQK
jgi:hypothetical protein